MTTKMTKQDDPVPDIERDSTMRSWASSIQQLWNRAYLRLTQGELGPWPILIGLVVIWLFFQSQDQHFLMARNLSNLVLQIGVVGTLAMGVVLVLLVGEIDLSLGAVSGVCAGVLGVLVTTNHWNSWIAIVCTVLIGVVIGLLQGGVTVYIGIPSFIVTLAGLLAWEGVQLILLGDVGELQVQDSLIEKISSSYLTPALSLGLVGLTIVIYAINLWMRRASRRRAGLEFLTIRALVIRVVILAVVLFALVEFLNAYFGVPTILVILLVLAVALTLLTTGTIFGRYIYAIGGNAEAARRAGIQVSTVRIAVFALTSAIAAFGGVISVSRAFAVSTGTGGGTLLLDAIAAAVIGGTSLFGGRGQIYQALLGALVIGSVQNGLDLLGQPSSTKDIATGIILVIAVSIDAISRRRRQAKGV